MIDKKENFESLIQKASELDLNNRAKATLYQLEGMKLLTKSIDSFNKQSGNLSKCMIIIAILQVLILLGQMFHWW